MDQNNAGKGSSSRFRWQQVSTQTRTPMFVDKGCQRCQHCMLRRLLPPTAVTARTPIADEEKNLEKTTCKQ